MPMKFTEIKPTPIPKDASKKWIPMRSHPDGGFFLWDLPDPPKNKRWDDDDDFFAVLEAIFTKAAHTPPGDWGFARQWQQDMGKLYALAKPFWGASMCFDCHPIDTAIAACKDNLHGVPVEDIDSWYVWFNEYSLWCERSGSAAESYGSAVSQFIEHNYPQGLSSAYADSFFASANKKRFSAFINSDAYSSIKSDTIIVHREGSTLLNRIPYNNLSKLTFDGFPLNVARTEIALAIQGCYTSETCPKLHLLLDTWDM